MNRNHSLTAIAVLSALACLGSGVFSRCATAAEQIGTVIRDTCALTPPPDRAGRIAVYGDIRAVNHNTVTIGGPQPRGPSVLVDIQQMDREDVARLAAICTRSGCREIMTGVVGHGRFQAERSYPQAASFVSPPACSSPTSPARVATRP
jgi:hypothetical protein